MKIYNLNKKILLQKSYIKEGGLEESCHWSDYKTLHAKVRFLTESSLNFYKKLDMLLIDNDNYYQITIRFTKEIDKNMRIQFKDQFFQIMKIINDNQEDRYLKLICKEIVK